MVGVSDTYKIEDLPDIIPVFPLPGVLLMPRSELPLNIFETRYIAMVDYALRTNRLIGMIQPKDIMRDDDTTPLYETGGVGRITSFEESSDGRYLITLKGVCRFNLAEETDMKDGFRQIKPSWHPFRDDLVQAPDFGLDRDRLKDLLCRYLALHGMDCEWEQANGAPDEKLVNCLSMICPLDPGEKQALLETICVKERGNMLLTMIDMALHGNSHKTADAGCH